MTGAETRNVYMAFEACGGKLLPECRVVDVVFVLTTEEDSEVIVAVEERSFGQNILDSLIERQGRRGWTFRHWDRMWPFAVGIITIKAPSKTTRDCQQEDEECSNDKSENCESFTDSCFPSGVKCLLILRILSALLIPNRIILVVFLII